MTAADLGNWQPLRPSEAAALLAPCAAAWWIAGGLAIDAFVRAPDRRPHEDLDVGILARDQLLVRDCLKGWDAWCADPPGTLRPWRDGEILEEPVHDVWLRSRPDAAWQLALMLNPSEDDVWVYRRDARIRRPVGDIVWRAKGVPYLAPEVQLLFKANTARPKDERDFDDALPLLGADRREWLRNALRLAHPESAWLARL